MNRLSYIADYHRIKVMGGKTDVLDPVVKCVEEGVGFDIKVTQDSDDPDRARMEIFYQNARLKKPVEERRTEHGVLQLPEVHTREPPVCPEREAAGPRIAGVPGSGRKRVWTWC